MTIRLTSQPAGTTGPGVIPIPYPAAAGTTVSGSPFDISAVWTGVGSEDRYATEGPAAWLFMRNDSDSLLLLLWPSSSEPCFLHPGEVMTEPVPRNEDHLLISVVAQNPYQVHPLEVLTVLGYNRRDLVNGHLLVQSATVNPSVPAAGVGPGPLPVGVIAQVLGAGSNPIFTARETGGPTHFLDTLVTENHGGTTGTALNGQVVASGVSSAFRLMNEDGTLPTTQLASAALPVGVTIGGAQVQGDIAANQVGPGALDSDVTIAGSQITGPGPSIAKATDLSVTGTAATVVCSGTTPNDGLNHIVRFWCGGLVGAGNTNNGVVSLTLTHTDPQAGAITTSFAYLSSSGVVLALNIAAVKGAGQINAIVLEAECSPNTTVSVSYQNTATGTISDRASGVIELMS